MKPQFTLLIRKHWDLGNFLWSKSTPKWWQASSGLYSLKSFLTWKVLPQRQIPASSQKYTSASWSVPLKKKNRKTCFHNFKKSSNVRKPLGNSQVQFAPLRCHYQKRETQWKGQILETKRMFSAPDTPGSQWHQETQAEHPRGRSRAWGALEPEIWGSLPRTGNQALVWRHSPAVREGI